MAAERNRNALRSQRLIREAYVTLVLERYKVRPTVADICREADINRSTFYAHYDNADDLADKLFSEYLDGYARWLEEALAEDFLANPLPQLTRLGTYIEDNRQLMRAFMGVGVRDDSGYGFGMAMRATLLPVMGDIDHSRLMRFDFICSALTSVYFTWFVGEYGEVPVSEVNESMARLIQTDRTGG